MRVILFIFILCFSTLLHGQEVLSTLVSNPILKDKKFISNKNKSALILPFLDDFSYSSPIADTNLWQQSSVFINRTYPVSPPTIGVATFDGLDENGLARDFLQSNPSEPSDTLLSKTIDLSGVNSKYMMFYFQAKGIGDAPETQDVIVLEFLNDTSAWEQIWTSSFTDTGQAMQEFEKVVELIDEQRFLHNSFQFRFRNYATLSGSFDHWHIDYVKLDRFINPIDTSKLDDIAFVYGAPSFLKRYEQMPWTHFKNNEFVEMNDTSAIFLRNNGASISVDYHYNVFENNNQIAHYPTLGPVRNENIFDYDSIGNFEYKNPPISVENSMFIISLTPLIDSVSFLIQHVISTGDDNKWNDTLYYQQEFNSSFAYDDGVAESAYGITPSGAKSAYQFKLNRPDTLRAIQMYFPQMLDSVNHIPFKLTVWNNNGGEPGSILHQQEVYPKHTKDGKHHYYYLDSLFQIIGTFYVGWEQQTNDPLYIGLDKNKLANQYMFYNLGSGWNNSIYPGAWMSRPILSMKEVILSSVNEIRHQFLIYPNPAKEELVIISSTANNLISIYNLQGILVKQLYLTNTESKINIADLTIGMYVIEVKNQQNRSFQKFIIR